VSLSHQFQTLLQKATPDWYRVSQGKSKSADFKRLSHWVVTDKNNSNKKQGSRDLFLTTEIISIKC